MLVRIPLTEGNTSVTPVYAESDPGATQPGNSTLPVRFSLSPASLTRIPDYNFSRYAHPAVKLDVAVPEADLPVVASWLGAAAADTTAASETLVKRMTAAVTDAISRYYANCNRCGLFTRPLRIGAALRHADGSFSHISEPVLLKPSAMAPLMAIREPETAGNTLHTVTEIINTPADIYLTAEPFEANGEGTEATHLVVFATRQCEVMTGGETVQAIRTFNIFGERVAGWSYNRLAEDIVTQKALADNAFRILTEIPLGEASQGIGPVKLNPDIADLNDWTSLPTFIGDENWDGQKQPDGKTIESDAFDLYRPEQYKKVKGAALRGIFPRTGGEAVTFSLYGSLHRDKWRLLGRTRGAYIRFLRAVGYRWFRIEIQAPYTARFDAVTFDISP